MAPVRIAVIGAGLIGRTHIAVLRSGNPDYTLAGVADPRAVRRRGGQDARLSGLCDRSKRCSTRQSLTASIVAVPNQMHVKVGLTCIARKIPIIVEKPVANSVAEALELIEAGEKQNVAILTGHHRRHNPIMRKAAEIIASGGIGRVVAANGLWLSHKPEKTTTWPRHPRASPDRGSARDGPSARRAGGGSARRRETRTRPRPRSPLGSTGRGRGPGESVDRSARRRRSYVDGDAPLLHTRGGQRGARGAAPVGRADGRAAARARRCHRRSRASLGAQVGANGGDLTPSDFAEADERLEQAASELAGCIEQIQAAGVLVKDLDRGLLDFPARREGDEILLCWHVGEDEIRFWHGVDEGFAGRKPLDT